MPEGRGRAIAHPSCGGERERRADVKPASLWQRLTRGGQRIHERPDLKSFIGPDWSRRIMQVAVTNDFHAKQGRLHRPVGDEPARKAAGW